MNIILSQLRENSADQGLANVSSEARKRNQKAILVDSRIFGPPKADFQRFLVGQSFARYFRGLKVAFVYQEELINKFAENTAINRGGDLLVVPDFDKAVKWLISGSRSY
jgi:hypothetical protein